MFRAPWPRSRISRTVCCTLAVVPAGLRTADGRVHEFDCLIWATGFRTNDFMFPMAISGRDGRTLQEAWQGGAHAHLGMCVPSFPNMFVMYGPNTNTSGGSIIVYLEAQAAYVRQALAQLQTRSAGAIEVRSEVEAASDRELQARFAGTAWLECDSWYRNDLGRICRYGTVRVSEPLTVETFAQVHHLVATVEGRLRPDVGPVDVIRAMFPGGSITGAPGRASCVVAAALGTPLRLTPSRRAPSRGATSPATRKTRWTTPSRKRAPGSSAPRWTAATSSTL